MSGAENTLDKEDLERLLREKVIPKSRLELIFHHRSRIENFRQIPWANHPRAFFAAGAQLRTARESPGLSTSPQSVESQSGVLFLYSQ